MMVPQPTAQYGHVERVSLARAIFSVRSCANAGFKSKPNTAAAAPPMVVNFRKSRRVGLMLGLLTAGRQGRESSRGISLIELASQRVKDDFVKFGTPLRPLICQYPEAFEAHLIRTDFAQVARGSSDVDRSPIAYQSSRSSRTFRAVNREARSESTFRAGQLQ